jgi:hypothetical protein
VSNLPGKCGGCGADAVCARYVSGVLADVLEDAGGGAVPSVQVGGFEDSWDSLSEGFSVESLRN